MTTRRELLKGAATGLVFCSCALLDAAHAQQPARAHRPVMIKGKRIKTIDVHAHVLFREATALMGDEAERIAPNAVKGAPQTFITSVAERLKAMDDMAIDMEVLSINPFWYKRERDVAAQIVKLQNEKLAELCAAQPERFAAFASLALQHPDLAVEQLDYAVKKLGL